jgi:hypothetical protein
MNVLYLYLFIGLSAFFSPDLGIKEVERPDGLILVSDEVQREEIPEGGLYCGGAVGDLWSQGTYHLENWQNGVQVDSYPLGIMTFVEGKLHDDLHFFAEVEGDVLYSLFQYASCSNERVQLFTLTEEGKIVKVPFIKEGNRLDEEFTEYREGISIEENRLNFCPYDNLSGQLVCDTYEYQNQELHLK